MSSQRLLHEAFAHLEPFVHRWALPSEGERNALRRSSAMDDLETFYNAMLPNMRAIISHLNQFPLESLPASEQRLLYMALSFMEVAIAVEMFKEPDETGAFPAEHYSIEEEIDL